MACVCVDGSVFGVSVHVCVCDRICVSVTAHKHFLNEQHWDQKKKSSSEKTTD